MINRRINILRNKFKKLNIDGYVIPKNDEFFSEYAVKDRLKIISNFSGSAGLAVVLKKNNYLFVDGRYTIQAKQQSGKLFKIIEIHKYFPHKIIKHLTLGFDPSLFTKQNLNRLYPGYGRGLTKSTTVASGYIDSIGVHSFCLDTTNTPSGHLSSNTSFQITLTGATNTKIYLEVIKFYRIIGGQLGNMYV